MNILVVGNVLKDVYLNLDTRTENFETDKTDTKWLDISFDASEHHFFNRSCNLSGAAISLEVLNKMDIDATISGSDIQLIDNDLVSETTITPHRYILIADQQISYLTPSNNQPTDFTPPTKTYDYIYVDRSANLSKDAVEKLNTYLDISPNSKLIVYLCDPKNRSLNKLIPRADLLFLETSNTFSEKSQTPELANFDPRKIVHIAKDQLSYLNIHEKISANRIGIFTNLSTFSIASATILGGFILGYSVENSLKMARANVENAKLNSSLLLNDLKKLIANPTPLNKNLELTAASLVLPNKGILAADESGGSIKKKFEQLNIPDTYENRRDYRNIFFSTPDLEKYVSGIILFDETTKQQADNGQNFVDYLTSLRIIPGIKVDQGLANFPHSLETYTKGLNDLKKRLNEYYTSGLRFAKWRAAFEIHLNESGDILTPTQHAIEENCDILAKYAAACQSANLVPIVEPEVVYDGYYPLEKNAEITGKILDILFQKLAKKQVNLRACILKTNMVIAGKNFDQPSSPKEVGAATAETLKAHIPTDLAGVVFLSGGQTPEQATNNLAEIIKNGPFPWPVTFSFARALQDPALYTWQGDNTNTKTAQQSFLERLIANCEALKEQTQQTASINEI